jgi:hypothetical protein
MFDQDKDLSQELANAFYKGIFHSYLRSDHSINYGVGKCPVGTGQKFPCFRSGPPQSVLSSNPELDPHDLLTENKGVINSASDVDVFTFVAGTGAVNLTINPAWDAYYRVSSRLGANLDVAVELVDLGGSEAFIRKCFTPSFQ